PLECREVLDALTAAQFDSYGQDRVYPQVMRFGVGVSDHRKDGRIADSYWSALETHRRAWLSLKLSFDPFTRCRERLAAHWPHQVAVGTHKGREMGAGVAREPNNGFQVHFDDARLEFTEDLLDAPQTTQFAFNLYLSVPEQGGETVIWQHRHDPRDEAHRLPGSYGYQETVVADSRTIEIKPTVGEALLFDPRHFHAVRPSEKSRRIALGFSIAVTTDGSMFTWG
ncbi:2OG-Fe(II) oxygenase, partial [Umezawaea sp.]|uniref:2OG-Fe(II)-dependent halogenase WelO5 family protein n=1 Tax=Umezawaea sp. TaxID=1955258 RepID=UPI002ED46E85